MSKFNSNDVGQMTLDGMMTFGKVDNNLHVADFVSTEYVEMEPWMALCKVQRMRDGNLYVTRLPKRFRNKPIFRQDHSSMSKSRNRKYYFVMIMDEADVQKMPETLMKEAREAAGKLRKYLSKD